MVSNALRFGATPVFFALALLLLFNPASDHGAMMCTFPTPHDTPSQLQLFGSSVPEPFANALPSMWLMYGLMGVFHASPWLALLGQGRRKHILHSHAPAHVVTD